MELWKRCGEASSNARLEAPLKALLRAVIAAPPLHSGFLNMLSLLEHVGSRKIMLSQMNGPLDRDTLQHMAEETRHAFFFKQLAERIAGTRISGYEPCHTLCPAPARAYFGRLDAEVSRALRDTSPRAPYLWVSFIVEIRAGWVYHFYQQALAEVGAGISLRSVIAEEDRHLADMRESLETLGAMNEELLARAAGIETGLFSRLLAALTARAGVGEPESSAARESAAAL
jgi:hypothetical protein